MFKHIPNYDPIATAAPGDWFDADAAQKALDFFPECLKHVEGSMADQPFVLEPWEQAIVACIFGWKRAEGTRRYREVFLYVPRGNGKTPFAAGIALETLFIDDEAGAQIYLVASESEQAALSYRHASGMVTREPELSARAQVFKGAAHRSIQLTDDPGSSIRVVSSDAGGKHGFNPHCVIGDELHAWPNRDLLDAIQTAFSKKGRKQPLLIWITTADFDRPSPCNEKYAYACSVRDNGGDPSQPGYDPSFLPIIFEAKESAYVEQVQSFDAMRRLDRICTCRHVHSTAIDQCWREACAETVWRDGTGRTSETTESDARTTLIAWSERGACAQLATNKTCSTETHDTKRKRSPSARSGLGATKIACEQRGRDGRQSPKASGGCEITTVAECTESHASNTRSCTNSKTGCAESVESQQRNSESIIATIQAACEDSCVPDAMLASVISATLKRICSQHSDICASRSVRVEGVTAFFDCKGDDWTDEKVWEKANPNIDVTVDRESLRRECRRAQEQPSYQAEFKRLHLNIRTTTNRIFIPLERWDRCNCVVDAKALEGRPCFGGLDISTNQDITAFVLVFPPAEERGVYSLLPFFWIPEEAMREREREDRVPYRVWVDQGLVFTCDGATINQADIRRFILGEAGKRFAIQEIGYDKWNAQGLADDLSEGGMTMVEIPQTIGHLTLGTKALDDLTVQKQIAHGGNPVLRWMMGCTEVFGDKNQNLRPVKPERKTGKRIDGIVASILALGRAMVGKEQTSVYEERGVRIL